MRLSLLLASLVAVALLTANAGAVTFGFSSGTRAGTADFSVSGSNLVVTLVNTSTFNTSNPSELLTAVFFDLAGSPTLTPVSAILTPGSVVQFGTTPGDGVVGGEWAYSGSAGALSPGGGDYGIGTAGFNIFGPMGLFPGPDLNSQQGPDGMDYGLLSAGNILLSGNAPVTGGNPLIDNGVIFTLSGLPMGFDEEDISNVWFQYGTDLGAEPAFPGVIVNGNGNGNGGVIPEPLTTSALLLTLGGLGHYLRKRRL